jgi:glycosyltransferase involved in cell wall biosynthesis/SAM-dependent methyltransferase
MPLVSVVTPTHRLDRIERAAKSLAAQTFRDFEWVVAINGTVRQEFAEAKLKAFAPSLFEEGKVRIVKVENNYTETAPAINGRPAEKKVTKNSIGYIKLQAFSAAKGDFLVELDHDDELAIEALDEVVKAFDNTPDSSLVYSQCLRVFEKGFKMEGTGKICGDNEEEIWDGAWLYYEATFNAFDGPITRRVAYNPPILPQNVSRIWWAPDHVRAFRASFYKEVGGHRPTLPICDDLDLMGRLFLRGPFAEVKAPLYRYVRHTDNSYAPFSGGGKGKLPAQNIPALTMLNHDNMITDLAKTHWGREGKALIDLRETIDPEVDQPIPGWLTAACFGSDHPFELAGEWPFEDDSVGAIRAASHLGLSAFENPLNIMNEAYRVLCHGGLFLIEVPSSDGRLAFSNPFTKSLWNETSFLYYTSADLQKFIKHAGVSAKFNVVRMWTYWPTPWHQSHNIPVVRAHLAAIKDGPELHGPNEIGPDFERRRKEWQEREVSLRAAELTKTISGLGIKPNQR